jgi:hypothetical protein
MLKQSMTLFWKDDHEQVDYFIMHYLFTVAVRKNALFAEEFEKIPFYSNRKPHLFDRLLHSKEGYSDQQLQSYYAAFFCQKLYHRHERATALLGRINELGFS